MKEIIKILYIDDNPMDRALVRDSLEREHEGFKLTEAKSQKEFEKQIIKNTFDLVLTDFNILGYEGLQVLDYVRNNFPDIPVIVVTGTGSEEIAVQSMKKGASDYVLKSHTHIKRLPETINSVLKAKKIENERNQAVKSLKDSEEKFRSLYENAPIPYQSLNEDGKFIDINPAWLQTLGYKQNEVIGKNFSDFLHPNFKNHFGTQFNKLKNEGNNCGIEFKLKHKEGHYLHVSYEAHAGFNQDGSFKQTYCVFQDITERIKSETAIKESDALLKKITANLPNSYMSIINKDLKIGFTFGKEFSKNNLDPNSFVGLSIEQIFGEHTAIVKENYQKTFKGEERSFELFINNQYQLYKTVPLHNSNNKIDRILSVVENITERKKVEENLIVNLTKYKLLFEKIPAGITITDNNGKIIESNIEAENLLSIPKNKQKNRAKRYVFKKHKKSADV